MEISNKSEREQKEFETLFKNPKHARYAWQEKVLQRYCKPAMKPIDIVDKDGELTKESQVEKGVWKQLIEEFKVEGIDRLPTDGEMMEAMQAYYARHNAGSYVARRDGMGAKPVDESKLTSVPFNPYEGMSDEELDLIVKTLNDHRLLKGGSNNDTN